jgi:hypothetical protein
MTTPTYIPDLSLDTREGWKAAYEAREREAHYLSERLIVTNRANARLRAANAALTEALEKISACAPTVLRITKENRESMQPFCIARHALRAALTSVEVPK